MKNLLLTLTFVLTSVAVYAQKIVLDPNHAKLQFEVSHMTISNVDGEFKKFEVQLDSKKEDLSDAKFTLVADIMSINTGVEARDNHLRGEDFFNAEKYPTLKFVTTSFTKGKNNNYILAGKLTMHGITKPVILNVKYNGSVINPMSNKKTHGFTITGSFKRSDFKIGTNFPEAIVGDTVHIVSNLEFIVD